MSSISINPHRHVQLGKRDGLWFTLLAAFALFFAFCYCMNVAQRREDRREVRKETEMTAKAKEVYANHVVNADGTIADSQALGSRK